MTPISILHVDDDRDLLDLTALLLPRQHPAITVVSETAAAAGMERLHEADIDCVVSDLEMPGADGLAFLREVRETFGDLPFVLFTGKGSEEVASEAINAGVTDYLQKKTGTEQYEVLANRVVNVVTGYRATERLARRRTQLETVASLSQRALAGVTRSTLLQRAAEAVADALGADIVAVVEHRPGAGEFDLVAAVGVTHGEVGVTSVPDVATIPAGYCIREGVDVVITDLATDDRFQRESRLREHGVVSGISVPIGAPDAPWGALGVHTTTPRLFTDDETRFVRTVANVLAAAIDRDRTERRLRESEAAFREIAEVSSDVIFRADAAGVLTYVSPSSVDVIGHTPAEMVATHFGEYVVSDDLTFASAQYGSVLDGEVVRAIPLSLRHADGHVIDTAVSATPVVEDEAVVAVQGFVRLIT